MLTDLFQRKLKLDLKLIHIIDRRPKMVVKLDPLDAEDFIVSHEAIKEWSENNQELYAAILENGMAEHICNREFLYEFYRHLAFDCLGLRNIDEGSLRFRNLEELSLVQNQIKVIEYLPANLKELYVDFNLISEVRLKDTHGLELLSLANNAVDDQTVLKIVGAFPELRCLNVSWNKIANIKDFTTNIAALGKLKVLAAHANPISMLAIYYSYITEHIPLAYFDGQKYVKVQEVKKEEPKVEEKKEQKKEEKKDAKNAKKGAKVEDKPPEEPPKVQPPKQVPKKELTREDFEQVRLNIKIGNLQKFTGNTYDISLFPPDTDITKTQTTYWVRYSLFGQQIQEKQKALTFDSATIDGQQVRLNLDVHISKTFTVNHDNFLAFNQGVKIEICQSQPKMIKDQETFEVKPEIKDNQVTSVIIVLGATHIDLRQLHTSSKKQQRLKYLLFPSEAVNSPLFFDPFEDQPQQIAKRKQAFQSQLKKQQEQRQKRQEQEQLQRQQKKGGKDQKKAADKKPPQKKDGKQPIATQKKRSQKCDFPVQSRQYCLINETMYKGRELLCIHIQIQ